MKISFVEVEGFRGIRNHLRINIPDGFVVITGRNGSGKSTVCDAIEFALTGALSKYEPGSERGESMDHYIWWRGATPAERKRVRVGICDDDGREFVLSRTPDGLEVAGLADARNVEAALCDLSVMSSDPLVQLCRTAIIRDETLAAMSVDQSEFDRFTFVRTALGTDALDDATRRGKDVLTALATDVQTAQAAYEKARADVTALLAELARARASASEVTDAAAAEGEVRRKLGANAPVEPSRLLAAARQRVATLRAAGDAVVRLATEAQVLEQEAANLQAPDAAAERAALESQRERVIAERSRLDLELKASRTLAAQRQETAPLRARLAALHVAGRSVGLRNGACPLCTAEQSLDQFQTALDALARELEAADREAASVDQRTAELARQVDQLTKDIRMVDDRLRRLDAAGDELSRRRALLSEQLRGHGAPVDGHLDREVALAYARDVQLDAEALGSALAVLEASASMERVAEIERRLAQARDISASLEAELRRLEAAESRAKRLIKGVRRAVGEVVEERLAALDPLLKDLYARLRPHNDWTDLRYTVRGDVRKMLSLTVGSEVNPRYTFSSGQRRAIGLAFLLAVHLSRPWCRLRTLILDDPVQHIDDFRALHLVEVLGAVRRLGQQIICAVEDEELAELICRRVRSARDGEGLLVRMGYRTGEGAIVESARAVAPAVRHLVVPS